MDYRNASVHPENKNGHFRHGYYTASGFIAREPRKINAGWHFPPEVFLGLPILIGILVCLALLVR